MRAVLDQHRRIAIDSSIFIYELEQEVRSSCGRVFAWIEQADHDAVTSTITMTELLVVPYREGDQARVKAIYGLLSRFPNLTWLAPDLETADLAARFRASYRMRTPDALQAAVAVRSGATAIVTNDAIFSRIGSFEAILFDRMLR